MLQDSGTRNSGASPQALKGRQAGSKLFVRQATGLVREASALDATYYNIIWSSVPLASVFLFLYLPAFYTGSNMYLAVFANALLCLPTAFLYAMLATAMPRSGGDYVWVSRCVHPIAGFMSNWNFVIWMLYFIGVYSALLGRYGVSVLLRVAAAFSGNLALAQAADFFAQPLGVIILGCILVIVAGAVFALGGLRTFLRIQKWAFAFYILGAVLVVALVVFFAGHSGFVNNFNSYIGKFSGSKDSYGLVNKLAAQAGYTPPAFNLGESLLAMTIAYYVFGNIFQSAYFGGEIKGGRRAHLLSMPGSLLIAVLLMFLLIAAFQTTIGTPFLGALGTIDPTKLGLGFTPLYTELAAIASNNIVIGLFIAFGFAVSLIIWVPQTILIISRCLFAWSFDRLIPEKVAEVSERTHSPTIAVSIIVLLSIVSVFLIALIPSLTALVGLLGLTFTLLSVAVAGILFPFRQRDTFEGAPFNGRVAGIPIVSVVGVLSLLGLLAIAWVLLADVNSGTSLAMNLNMVFIAIGIYLSGLIVYLISRYVQRARGVNITLAYQEIPPE